MHARWQSATEDTQAEVAQNNREFLTGGVQLQETKALAQVFDGLTRLMDTGDGLDFAKLHNITRADASQAALGNLAHVLHGADSTVRSQYETGVQAQSDSPLGITSDAVSDGRDIERPKIGPFEAGLDWVQASDDPVPTQSPAPNQSQNPLSLPLVSPILNQNEDDDHHRGGLLGGLLAGEGR